MLNYFNAHCALSQLFIKALKAQTGYIYTLHVADKEPFKRHMEIALLRW